MVNATFLTRLIFMHWTIEFIETNFLSEFLLHFALILGRFLLSLGSGVTSDGGDGSGECIGNIKIRVCLLLYSIDDIINVVSLINFHCVFKSGQFLEVWFYVWQGRVWKVQKGEGGDIGMQE